MKTAPRILALFLSLAIGLPNPVFALREPSAREKKPDVIAGLEEALRGNPDQLLQLASTALVPSPAVPVSTPAVSVQKSPLTAGAEEATPGMGVPANKSLPFRLKMVEMLQDTLGIVSAQDLVNLQKFLEGNLSLDVAAASLFDAVQADRLKNPMVVFRKKEEAKRFLAIFWIGSRHVQPRDDKTTGLQLFSAIASYANNVNKRSESRQTIRSLYADWPVQRVDEVLSEVDHLLGRSAAGAEEMLDLPPAQNLDEVADRLAEHEVKWLEVRFVDSQGRLAGQHKGVLMPVGGTTLGLLQGGVGLDGSSVLSSLDGKPLRKSEESDFATQTIPSSFGIYRDMREGEQIARIDAQIMAPADVVSLALSGKQALKFPRRLPTVDEGLDPAAAWKEALRLIRQFGLSEASLVLSDWRENPTVIPVAADKLEEAFASGVPLEEAQAQYLPFQGPKAGFRAVPDPYSLRFIRYPDGSLEAVLATDMLDSQGNPFEGDPRGWLKKMQNRFEKEMGLRVFMAPEPELYLFRPGEGDARTTADTAQYYDAPGQWPADVRSAVLDIVRTAESAGIEIRYVHHEVGPGQFEMPYQHDTPVKAADRTALYKHIVKQVAARRGLTASFLPKPIPGRAGNGMHIHQSLVDLRNGMNVFFDLAGDFRLSGIAWDYMGGLLRFAPATLRVTNPDPNSYLRIVPHQEAPTRLAISDANRSAAVRIPAFQGESAARFEARWPDPIGNIHAKFSAILLAGWLGIRGRMDPRKWTPSPVVSGVNIYDLSEEERKARGIEELPGGPGGLEKAARLADRPEMEDWTAELLGPANSLVRKFLAQPAGLPDAAGAEETIGPVEDLALAPTIADFVAEQAMKRDPAQIEAVEVVLDNPSESSRRHDPLRFPMHERDSTIWPERIQAALNQIGIGPDAEGDWEITARAADLRKGNGPVNLYLFLSLRPTAGAEESGIKSLLIVEDDPEILETLVQITQAWRPGIRVITSQNMKTAKFSLEKLGPFDAMVTDMDFPGGSGVELIQDPAARGLPSAVFSGAIVSWKGVFDTLKGRGYPLVAYAQKPSLDLVSLKQPFEGLLAQLDAEVKRRASPAAGLDEPPSAVEVFRGLFQDGDPGRMVSDPAVAVRLQTGDRKTIKVELERIGVDLGAARVPLGRLFVQEGAVVPVALRGLAQIGISDDPAAAARQLEERSATAADLAFLAPAALERSAEWNAVLQGKLAGIIVTREALAALEQLLLRDPAYLAAFVAGARKGTGLITILSIEVDEQTPGQRRLYLYA